MIAPAPTADLRLGLIGDNIAASKSPRLHVEAGRQKGVIVSYDRLVPREAGLEFDALFARAAQSGYRGVNITYPYKERAARMVRIPDPLVRAIGAVNTAIFGPDGPVGHNTDHTGFIAAYREVRGAAPVGTAVMIGAGGVGRAVAFALIALKADGIRLVDREMARAEALAADLAVAAPGLSVQVVATPEEAAAGADGIINCTPVGMVGHEGVPVGRAALSGAVWAFDAVYTPVGTRFLRHAKAEGLSVISGYELFFFQGVKAWGFFHGSGLDEAALRKTLAEPEPALS